MLTYEEIQYWLTSTETARVERTISTGEMDKFSEVSHEYRANSQKMATALPSLQSIG